MAESDVRNFGSRRLGALLAGVALIMLAAAPVSAGNNGTLKIHEGGTPLQTSDNDPKVACSFDVEAFNLDVGQTGLLVLSSQGGDGPANPDVGPVPFGPADGDGYAIAAFNDVPTGHYVATLYGKDGDLEVKAKSKVFKVICEGGGGGGGGGGVG